jgi:hypothetical protein
MAALLAILLLGLLLGRHAARLGGWTDGLLLFAVSAIVALELWSWRGAGP